MSPRVNLADEALSQLPSNKTITASSQRGAIPIHDDPDTVRARKSARDLASRIGYSRTDLTMIATAVSEITRNIVRFAGSGELVIELLETPHPGVRVVARDTGPGLPDVQRALAVGYSTYNELGRTARCAPADG